MREAWKAYKKERSRRQGVHRVGILKIMGDSFTALVQQALEHRCVAVLRVWSGRRDMI